MEERNFGYLGFSFQQSLIKAIIEDKKFGEVIIDVLETKFFDNNSFRYIIENLKELFLDYNKIPTYETLSQKIISENSNRDNNRIHLDTLEQIKNIEGDTSFVKDTALNFCKQQNLKKELKLVTNIIDNGNFEEYNKIEQIIQKALQVGVEGDDATDVFHDIDSALEKDYRRTIPTGVSGLDNLLKGGIGIGELGIILAPTGTGKSLPISEPILTPNGWTTMGEVKLGDEIIGSDGEIEYVLGVYPQGIRPIYKMEFTDGTFVNCDEEHLWSVNTLNMRTSKTRIKGKVVYNPNFGYITMKTSDMMVDIKKRGRYNYRLPIVEPVEFNERELTIDPYLLGLLLGDGSICDSGISISTKDDELFENIKYLGEHTSYNEYFRTEIKSCKSIRLKTKIKNRLNDYQLLNKKSNNKFIPKDYLYNTSKVRIALLQGLMDTDGFVDKKGITQYCTISKQLCDDVRELVLSLGGTAKIKTKNPNYTYNGEKKLGQLCYILTISFANDIVPFKLLRKIERYRKRKKYIEQKFIKSISYSHDEESVCIKVSNPDELYVTRDYVLTHNTTFLTKIGNTAFNHDMNVLQIFFEDNPGNIKRKHYTIWTGIEPDEQPLYSTEVKEKVMEAESHSKGKLKLLKFPSDSITVSDIKNKIRKYASEGFKVDLLIIDYVDCISNDKSTNGEEWKGEGSVMRHLESMTTEFDIAIWTATQGSRDSISSEVVTSDQMGGSIKKAQIAHIIVSIAKTLEQKEHGLATLSLLKSRIGQDGVVWQNCKFDNKLLIIDTESQSTLLGMEEQKVQNNAARAAEMLRRRQERNQVN